MVRVSKAKKNRLSMRIADPVLPESFRESRRRLRWTVDQVADFLWVTEVTVRNWEAGKASLS
jgi:DNA-binding transcriptional regulator YiaG